MHRGKLVDPAAITRHRAARDRGRARRYFGHRPDQGGARPRDQAAGGEEAISTSPRTSAITASSTAASGARRSRRWSRSSSPPTTRRSSASPVLTRNTAAALAATAAMAAPTSARWKPPISASPSRARTTPSKAVAIRPPVRATALLKPEAVPTCCSSTEPSTDAVSGATAIAMPAAITAIAGKTLVQ